MEVEHSAGKDQRRTGRRCCATRERGVGPRSAGRGRRFFRAGELGSTVERRRAENREYWLGNVTIRYDTMASAVQEKINEINVLEDNYSRLGELPTPESVGFVARPALQQGGH